MSGSLTNARVDLLRPSGARPGWLDVALVRDGLAGLAVPGAGGRLTVAVPRPTAAFSRRDTLLPGWSAARDAAEAAGWEAIVRPVGGHLAAYGTGSLVLHLWAPHPSPREGIRERFAVLSGAVADALRGLGADARVGPVPGEYCDGEFSVNAGGRAKLVGTGQRIVRGGFLWSAVVVVEDADAVCGMLVPAYRALGLDLDPTTVGGVADVLPGVTVDEVADVLVDALCAVLPLPTRPKVPA